MFLFCLVYAMSLCASVYMCFVVTCWERADLLALIFGAKCDFVTFPLVSWVRCGTYFVSIPDLCTLTYLNVSIFFIFCTSSFKCNNYGTVYIVGFQ